MSNRHNTSRSRSKIYRQKSRRLAAKWRNFQERRRENIAAESRHAARRIETATDDKQKMIWGRVQRGLRELLSQMR